MLREHLQARWASAELDRRLAEGADPHGDRLLELRAAHLVASAARASVANGLERVVASVDRPKSAFSAAIAVRRRPVRGARHDLMALADDLRRVPALHPRGIAMAERLITDPAARCTRPARATRS